MLEQTKHVDKLRHFLESKGRLRNFGQAQKTKNGRWQIIWADHHLVMLTDSGPIHIEGEPLRILKALGRRVAGNLFLDLHYQGGDLLLLPPLRGVASLSLWLEQHLPPKRSLDDYLLAFTSSGNKGPTALLPKEKVVRIFRTAREAGFVGTKLIAMPGASAEPGTLLLANGLWRMLVQADRKPSFLPLPMQQPATLPAMLQPKPPLRDGRWQAFADGLFIWEDAVAKSVLVRRNNRRWLTGLGLAVGIVFALAWLGLGWYGQHLEDRLINQSLEEKHRNQTQQAYQERRGELDTLLVRLQHHPLAKRRETYAADLRRLLNGCAPQVVLAGVQVQIDRAQRVCLLEGFAPDTASPIAVVNSLQSTFDDAGVDLIALDALPEKRRLADKRLRDQKQWYRFTIRLERA